MSKKKELTCPKCKYKGEVILQIKTIVGFQRDNNGEDQIDELSDIIRNWDGQYEYDVSSRCTCPKCGKEAKLFQFGW